MNPTTPTEVQVITEMDVYAASVRKVVSNGNLNASPLAEPSYSWSDVEAEEANKPKVQEELHAQDQSNLQKSAFTESVNEQLDKLMTEIEDIGNKKNNVKVDVELESDEDMPELVDSESDMPDLVSESDEMPGLVEESDDEMPDLVEESDEESDDLMIAIFKRPSCPRCEAALKVLMAHDENGEESSASEEEHTYDESESEVEDESESDDDSDSDYVPSESESESPRTVRQLRRWNMASQTESVQNKRTRCIPPLIQFIFTVLVVVHILKFLLNEPSQRIRCYS